MTLYGEGQYELTDIKQVVGTESFLGLSEETRQCQTRQSHSDCVSLLHRERLLSQCACSPAHLLTHFPHGVNI